MAGKSVTGAQLLVAVAVCFICAHILPAQTAPPQDVFSVADASKLLRQINDGLINGKSGKFFSAFDLTRMTDGQLFKQQVTSFVSHTDSVRTHLNLTETAMDGEKGTATVEAELEADPRDGNTPPLHKQATLHFVAERTSAGWKFTDVQPRSFFSTASGGGSTVPRSHVR